MNNPLKRQKSSDKIKRYSIWHIYLFLFFFLAASGIIFVFGISFFFYQFNVNKIITERTVNLQTLANTIGSPFWVHQELLHIPGTVENFMRETAKIPNILFVRMVNIKTGVVEKSGNRREVGIKIKNLPSFKRDIIVRDGVFANEPIKEFTIKSQSGDNLWMGVSLKNTKRNILLATILLGEGILVLFVIAGLAVFWVFRRFMTNPLIMLSRAFELLKKENYNACLANAPSVEMQNVFTSFNSMVQKLAQIREREKTLTDQKSEFISITAHQLRTPLSATKWGIRLVLDGELGKINDKQREILDKSYHANERMINLIGDLLNVASIEEGKFGYKFKKDNIINVLNEMIDNLRPMALERDVKLSLEKPKEKLPEINFDIKKIKLALDNLISNAIRYTLPKGYVKISVEQKSPYLLIKIKDSGVGIPADQINKLFTKFMRGENVVKLQTEGTGLGLYLVKNIAEAHGGKVWVESEEGKGSTFFLALPI